MKLRSAYILVLVFSIILLVAGCKKAAPPVLKEIGPTKTKAGVAFNVQPDGGAAMWFKTENATKTLVIMWDDKQVRSDFKRPDFLTAPVPKELYSKRGQYQIYLLDTKTGVRSNSIVFAVE